jgi:hypothetical protein
MAKRLLAGAGLISLYTVIVAALALVGRWMWDFLGVSRWESGWAQAVGGVLGIGVAIYVPYRQRQLEDRRAEQARMEESRRVIQALQDEIVLMGEKFNDPDVHDLLALGPEEFFNTLVPVPAERFPVYRSHLGRLVLIPDAELRRAIISCYGAAEIAMETVVQNNRLLQAYYEIEEKAHLYRTEYYLHRLENHRRQLRESTRYLQAMCRLTVEQIEALLPLMAVAARREPGRDHRSAA